MKRRAFVAGMAAVMGAPWAAHAQQPAKVARLGILAIDGRSPYYVVFRRALEEHGWIEGENILLEFRSADGKPELLPKLAAELVDHHVDLIFASVTQAAIAARNVTRTTPIVMATAGNPIGDGLVKSLARPGGNVTGLTSIGGELANAAARWN